MHARQSTDLTKLGKENPWYYLVTLCFYFLLDPTKENGRVKAESAEKGSFKPKGLRICVHLAWDYWWMSGHGGSSVWTRMWRSYYVSCCASTLEASFLLSSFVLLLASSSSSSAAASSFLLSRTLWSSCLSCCLLLHLSLSETRDRRWRALLVERLNRNSRNKIQFGRSGSESSVSEVHISKWSLFIMLIIIVAVV